MFETLTNAFSTPANAIIRCALMSTKDWFPILIREPALDTITVCPILIDTVECLTRREIPIVRLSIPNGRIIVDRYAGLCTTLLPLLYDLCTLSYDRKVDNHSATTAAATESPDTDYLTNIEQSIQSWKPTLPPNFFTDYTKEETLLMTTQSEVYRLAALLIIHRLRYPLGINDEPAIDLAKAIFSQLYTFAFSMTISMPQKKQPALGALPVVFPLMLAMLEIEGPGETILSMLSSFTVQTICASRMTGFINEVRAARQAGFDGLWFDLVDSKLHVSVIP